MSITTQSPNDELISAYLDGEVTDTERAEVERLLAEDPAAKRLADALSEVSRACRDLPRSEFHVGLADRVLAEAQRRIADGADKPTVTQANHTQPDHLEPEGDFGLPFGRSARGWGWAVVAAAAAVMISFTGRNEPPPQNTVAVRNQPSNPATQVAWQRIKQAAPQARLVNLTTTPQGLVALQQKLAQQGIQLAVNPPQQAQGSLNWVPQAGLAVDSEGSDAADEQLMLISADPQRTHGLIDDLAGEGELFQVEPEREPENTQSAMQPSAQSQPGVALRIKATGDTGSAPVRQVQVPPGTVVLRIIVVRPQAVAP